MLGHNEVKLRHIQLYPLPVFEPQVISAYAPVCCYSTIKTTENKNRTVYYTPADPKFRELVRSNLLKKHIAYYRQQPDDANFSIEAAGPIKEVITYYGSYLLKGYQGIYKISGSPELIRMAFASGLGSKNAQGMGLIVPRNIII